MIYNCNSKSAVFLSGASSGIGATFCNKLLNLGFFVISIGRTSPTVCEKFSSRLIHLKCDLNDNDYEFIIENWIEKNRSNYIWKGFVHCAGLCSIDKLVSTPVEIIRKQINVNLSSALVLSKTLLPILKNSPSKIFFLGSRARRFAFIGGSSYCASKAGLFALSDCLALEVRELDWPIGVSIFEFGPVATTFGESIISDKQISVDGAANIILHHFLLPHSDFDTRVIEIVPSVERFNNG
jgi:NAD(P)-dependent dehydrogenase (short-subunit alcohol dehydrogenase family)